MTNKPVEMYEIGEPEVIQWTAPGMSVSGTLLEIETVQMDGKSVQKYTLGALDGSKEVCVFGTVELNRKLQPKANPRALIGRRIDIRYEGEDASIENNGNKMKRFRVLAERRPASSEYLRDEDIA